MTLGPRPASLGTYDQSRNRSPPCSVVHHQTHHSTGPTVRPPWGFPAQRTRRSVNGYLKSLPASVASPAIPVSTNHATPANGKRNQVTPWVIPAITPRVTNTISI